MVLSRLDIGTVVALLCVFVIAGCATYSSSFGVIEKDLAAQQYDAALQDIEKQATVKKDRVLYLLNKGMVMRMKHDFVASNEALEAAKTEMERLYAASVHENALSFIVNDATVSYAGDDYEQVLVHLYMALNYLELQQPDDARVEALQVDQKLREISEKIPASKFTEDALSRYLTGLIYDERGEWSDAMIAYRKAYEAYKKYQANFGMPMPSMLGYDLMRLAKREGLNDEVVQYRKEFGINPKQEPIYPTDGGEVVFILSNGLAPIKREKSITVLDPASGVMVRIALPHYESRSNDVAMARISAGGKVINTETMENIDAIARKSLDARMAAITARSIARAVVKTSAVRASSGDRNNDSTANLIGGLITQVTAIVTERADTRSWLTLPANVQLARLSLPVGSYTITIELLGAGGQIISTRDFPGVVVRQAHKTYLTEHWVPLQSANSRRYQ
jgi:hypothetical protein